MRKVTAEIVQAFRSRAIRTIGNSSTDGKSLFLHGNEIARWDKDGDLLITNAGWSSNTTKERLNGLPGVSIQQKAFEWYLNGMKWGGEWVRVTPYGFAEILPESEKKGDGLRAVAMVAAMGDIFGKTEKEKNDWKARMLKAGLENRGLIMPDNWNELTEEEKKKRLDAAIDSLKR